MTTLTTTYSQLHHRVHTLSLQARYRLFIKKLEFAHFGFIAMALLISTCLGGIATMYVFQNDAPLWQFILSLCVSTATLVACIAQAPTKWAFNLFSLSVLVNVLLILANTI